MKSLYALLTDQFTFAIFYAGMIAILTLWAMALLTRRVRRLTNHVEGLQQDLRLVNDALKTLTNAGRVRETVSVDSVLGPSSGIPSSPSTPAFDPKFSKSSPMLDVTPAPEKKSDPVHAAGAALHASQEHGSDPQQRRVPSAAPLPAGAVRPSIKVAIAKEKAAEAAHAAPAAAPAAAAAPVAAAAPAKAEDSGANVNPT